MLEPPRQRPRKTTHKRRWANADAEARHTMIVDVAVDLLHREGLEAVTMRRVAQQLGVGTMTLYTYVDGQPDLRKAMIQRGFAMLSSNCCAAHDASPDDHWGGGARNYLRFAMSWPNLYGLMFAAPVEDAGEVQLLMNGFAPLLARVTARLSEAGLDGEPLRLAALKAAGRYWIALHGLASLAIAGRLPVLEADAEHLLEDLLERVAPT